MSPIGNGVDLMKTDIAVERLKLKCMAGSIPSEYSGVYVGDLLSRAMSRVGAGNIWITIMNNVNVIAVASLTEAACVILAEGAQMNSEVLSSAADRDVCVLSSELTAYELCCGLSRLADES